MKVKRTVHLSPSIQNDVNKHLTQKRLKFIEYKNFKSSCNPSRFVAQTGTTIVSNLDLKKKVLNFA